MNEFFMNGGNSNIYTAVATSAPALLPQQAEKQARIEMALKFLNLLFGAVVERIFGYLWTKQDKATYPFAVSNATEREAMAKKAIELSDEGKDVYFGINLMNESPARNSRVKAAHVTLQTATVTDIDILGGEHTDPNKYPADFNAAKEFLPFPVSLTVFSGYGLHGYCLYVEPIIITAENRSEVTKRNRKFIDAIRSRAGKYVKAVDSVHDLPRVLRMPGTFNYKCGRENAPLCRLVEVNDVRFTPAELDEKLNASITPKEKSTQQKSKPHSSSPVYQSVDDRDRALNMLAVIPVADLSRDEWLNIGMALKNNGNNVSDWEQWSRADERFKEGECEKLWQGFTYGGGLTIATIHDIAKRFGYQEPSHSNHSDETRKDNVVRTRDRISDCPVNLILPENFIWTKKGITQLVPSKKKDRDFDYFPVTATPIIITREFCEPIKHRTEYEIAMLLRGKWIRTEVDGKTLTEARLLTELGNYGAIINEVGRLKKFFDALRACNPDLPQVAAYKQTGWTSDDFEDFAYPSATGNAVVRREGYDYERIFKPKGNPNAWKEKFVEVTEQGGAVACVFIGAACAASLVRPLNLPNLQLHLFGPKSIGKTPLLKFAVSIFGDPNFGSLTHTFAATPKSRLETASAFSDLPLIFDELESLNKREAERLPDDIYNYSLGIGGQALKKDGTKREVKLFSGVRLTTGEHSIVQQSDNGGVFKRVLDIRAAKLFDEDFASDLYGFCNRNRGLFGEQWIRYSIANQELISKHYHQTFNTVRAAQKGKLDENDRTQLATLVSSVVMYQHFKICIGLQNLTTDSDAINAEIANIISSIIAILPTAAEMDDTARAIEFLKSFVAGSEKYFWRTIKNSTTGRKEDICHYTADGYGKFLGKGAVAFLPHALKMILEEKGGFKSADKLIAEFYDKGYLRTRNGRYKVQTWINGKPVWTYNFAENLLRAAEDDTAEEEVSFNG